VLWWVRGLIDLPFGGAGTRRGRRDPDHLKLGDTVDFWRVEAIEPSRLLRLRAEMSLPGRAWRSSRSSPIGTDHWSARQRSSILSAYLAGCTGTGSGQCTVRSFAACCTASPELRPRRGLRVRGSSLQAELRREVSLPWATARIGGPPSCHSAQTAPSSRSTCRTSLDAMRRTHTCRGPITSKVAQNSRHDPAGHIDSASTSIRLTSWHTMK
jgi:hypothetical protein